MNGFRYDCAENYHLTYSDAPQARKILIITIVVFAFIICIFFPAVFWLFSLPEYPHGSHSGRGGIARLIFLLPLYFRLPLVALVIAVLTTGMIAYIVRLADRRADFLFGPDGVAHVGVFVSKSLLWNDIARLDLVQRQRRHLFVFKQSTGRSAEFVPKPGRSVKLRARSILTALLSVFETNGIIVDMGAVGMTPDEFERAMLHLRPDLQVNRRERVTGA